MKETIKLTLPDYATLHEIIEEPVAYGLVALIAHIIIPEEKSGGLDEVEKRLRGINETSEIEILMVRRI